MTTDIERAVIPSGIIAHLFGKSLPLNETCGRVSGQIVQGATEMASLVKTLRKYPPTFWIANLIELLERWGWYGMYMVLALYLTSSRDLGALGFTQIEKGMIMGIGTAILYFLPVITGAIADRIGYKVVLSLSMVIYATGFFLLGQVTEFYAVFAVYIFIAIGSAMFKPVPAATIAKTTDEETSSIGFGIYYMMVNIGGVIGPVFAAKLRPHALTDENGNYILNEMGKPMMDGGSWVNVFYASAIIMAIGLVIVSLFYKEPDRKKQEGSLLGAIAEIIRNLYTSIKDIKLLIFLVLIIGFWTMYYQLFYTLPVFIDQWLDTAKLYDAIASFSPWLASVVGTENGTISAEMLTTLPAIYIVLLQVLVSTFVMKWRPINAMIAGIFVNCIGLALSFLTNNPFYIFFSILIFALGEMSSSPKITEYLGRIAPKDKRGLYIGCSFLPVAGGSFFAGMLSGVYQEMSDKIVLLERLVVDKGFENIPKVSETFSQTDLINAVSREMGITIQQLNQYLWDNYHPYSFWAVVAAIGVSTVILLLLYDKFILKGGTHGAE
jgi:POT family proton-dependent oligopeptide transporter